LVIDGLAVGDQLGSSLAAADVDHDSADEMVIGAPGAESNRGSAFLIYGRQGIAGLVSLTGLGLCDLGGWQLVGGDGQAMAVSLSSGDINGDSRMDVVLGAPGTEGGAAYVVFGQGPQFETTMPPLGGPATTQPSDGGVSHTGDLGP
jgi:hypothetical protein